MEDMLWQWARCSQNFAHQLAVPFQHLSSMHVCGFLFGSMHTCQVACMIMHAGVIDPGVSEVLRKMGSWTNKSNWSRNLHKLIYKFNMTLPVESMTLDLPVQWQNKHIMMPWPCLPFSSWMKTIFEKSFGQPLLAGHKLEHEAKWKCMFQTFWARFREASGGSHQVFEDHAGRLEVCVPVFIHGDEGRGKLRRAVMATSVQPVLVAGGHAGHSFNSRFLHHIMPGELYEGDSTLQILQEALVEDLQFLYTHGCTALWFDFSKEL